MDDVEIGDAVFEKQAVDLGDFAQELVSCFTSVDLNGRTVVCEPSLSVTALGYYWRVSFQFHRHLA
ncbi:MAG: hypothetical protein ABSH21_10445 [Verrucomicrobiia bacterium]